MSHSTNGKPGIPSLISGSPATVTVFTLSWCSFCHAVKHLLQGLNIPFHVVELDTGEYREPVLNARLREELLCLTGRRTLPQVFVGDHNIGGYTETQTALRQGQLSTLLADHGIVLKGASETTE
jgi:glutaredoxin 3